MLATLNHPGIVHTTDLFLENDTAYYVMNYIEGESLSSIIKRQGVLDVEKAKYYLSQCCEALGYLHSKGISHFDIKPANIMIQRHGDRVVLIDFGVSKQYDTKGSQASTTNAMGITPGYSAPEQYRPGGVSRFSPVTDIYALGATLYTMLVGHRPADASEIYENGITEWPEHLPFDVRQAIVVAMHPDAKQRPANVMVFNTLLTNPVMPPPPPPEIPIDDEVDIVEIVSAYKVRQAEKVAGKGIKTGDSANKDAVALNKDASTALPLPPNAPSGTTVPTKNFKWSNGSAGMLVLSIIILPMLPFYLIWLNGQKKKCRKFSEQFDFINYTPGSRYAFVSRNNLWGVADIKARIIKHPIAYEKLEWTIPDRLIKAMYQGSPYSFNV